MEDETIDEVNVTSRRVLYNVGLNLNAGTMIKFGENYGEIKIGVSNYFRNHLNAKARDLAYTHTEANGMAVLVDDYVNLVYQLSFSFNLPFFKFQ